MGKATVRKLLAWTLIFTMLMGIMPITATGGDTSNSICGENGCGNAEAPVYFNDTGQYNDCPDGGEAIESEESDEGSGGFPNGGISNGDDPGDSYFYSLFSIPFTPFGEVSGNTYEWDDDATDEDLTGVTEVIMKSGASGTLNLVEPTVTMAVYEGGISGLAKRI